MGYKQIFNALSGAFDTVLDTESPAFTGTVSVALTTPGIEQLTSSSTALTFSLENIDIANGTVLKAEIESGQMALTYDDGIQINAVYPVLPQHVTTKAYVDAAVAAVAPSVNVPLLNINWASGNVFYKEIAADSTFTFSNVANGADISLVILNTSGASITLTFPTLIKKSNFDNIVLAGKENVYAFIKSNGKVYASSLTDMA
jgi:hypothetical protein